jgi:hypothetical protein
VLERDERLIDSLLLAQVDTGEKRPAEPGSAHIVPVIKTDEELAAWTRAALARCGATIAQDVIDLGCTGIAGNGANVEQIKKLRAGLAGSGLGLPCYIGPDRYCLAHETIGGLQEGQAQRHAQHVAAVSRELAPNERSHVAVIEAARRTGKSRAAEALTGRRTGEDFLQEVGRELAPPDTEIDLTPAAPTAPTAPAAAPPVAPVAPAAVAPAPVAPRGELAFVCPDHDTTQWHCRYCIAEEIVKGPLSPTFLLGHAEVGTTVMLNDVDEVDSDKIDEKIQAFNEAGADGAVLFVKVARWVRKLARA